MSRRLFYENEENARKERNRSNDSSCDESEEDMENVGTFFSDDNVSAGIDQLRRLFKRADEGKGYNAPYGSLVWYKERSQRLLPIVSKFISFLCVPASSATAETHFSGAKHVENGKHTLSEEALQSLTFSRKQLGSIQMTASEVIEVISGAISPKPGL